jgi:dTDP-glucose pyrophosphorylase
MKTVNLIPMAGAGQRFVDAGYKIPKPLIEVGNKPMIVRAARSLPSCDKWVFVCRDFHIRDAKIDESLQAHFPRAKVVSVDHLTEGQACTCMLAADFIDDEDFLNIGACDNAMAWKAQDLQKLLDDDSVDAWIWTFRNNPAVLQNPKAYGWVDVDADNLVRRVSVKIPLSDNPMQDHAVIGAFSFRRFGDFRRSVDTMIASNRRINNEFYVDEVMNLAVEAGLKVRVFEVDRYICWGTPRDLETYEYWRGYFRSEFANT